MSRTRSGTIRKPVASKDEKTKSTAQSFDPVAISQLRINPGQTLEFACNERFSWKLYFAAQGTSPNRKVLNIKAYNALCARTVREPYFRKIVRTSDFFICLFLVDRELASKRLYSLLLANEQTSKQHGKFYTINLVCSMSGGSTPALGFAKWISFLFIDYARRRKDAKYLVIEAVDEQYWQKLGFAITLPREEGKNETHMNFPLSQTKTITRVQQETAQRFKAHLDSWMRDKDADQWMQIMKGL